jgi:hypothetical protein
VLFRSLFIIDAVRYSVSQMFIGTSGADSLMKRGRKKESS